MVEVARAMRILHVYKDYFPVLGGIENHVRVLAEAQARAGHQVIALVCNLGSRTTVEELNGVKVVKSGRMATVASMPISLSQPLAVARLRPDVIHVHSPYPLGEVSAWLLGRGSRLVITHHSDVVRQKGLLRLYGPVLRRVLRRADRIFDRQPQLHADLRLAAAGAGQVHRGAAGGGSGAVRAAGLAICRSRPCCSSWGVCATTRGLDTLLHALVALPDLALSVVGEGAMRTEWEELAASLGIASRVRFVGEVDDDALPGIYRQATAFVLPANAPIGVLWHRAAGSHGQRTALRDHRSGHGHVLVVQDGVTGLVVPPKQPGRASRRHRPAPDRSWPGATHGTGREGTGGTGVHRA